MREERSNRKEQNTPVKESPVVQAAYRLSLQAAKAVAKFPVKIKFTVGDKFSTACLELLNHVATGASVQDSFIKASKLRHALEGLLNTRLLLRLSRDLNGLSAGQYVNMSLELDEIQKQVKSLLHWAEQQLEVVS